VSSRIAVSSRITPKAPPVEAHHAPAFGAILDHWSSPEENNSAILV
jgi:hypothetical protein